LSVDFHIDAGSLVGLQLGAVEWYSVVPYSILACIAILNSEALVGLGCVVESADRCVLVTGSGLIGC